MLYTILVGLLVGSLAGWFMKSSHAWYIDILLGLIGAVVGGWIFGALGIALGTGFISDLVTGVIGAVVVIAIVRLVRK